MHPEFARGLFQILRIVLIIIAIVSYIISYIVARILKCFKPFKRFETLNITMFVAPIVVSIILYMMGTHPC